MKKLVILLIVIFLFFIIKNLIYQYKHYNSAKQQDGIAKVKAYEKVILSYVPFSPLGSKAVEELYLYCHTFKKDDERLYCLETLRTSIYQIQNPITRPYTEYLEKINPEIAKLRALESINWEFNNYTMADYKKLYNAQMQVLNYDNKPSDFWSLIVVLSLIGWISSVLLFIWKANNKKQILLYSLIFIVFFSLWIVSLYKA
ncbi:hypothetical protein SYO3AOP1_1009 [Sulfurihydrogenibium sp. YO3AOP1]|uniref:ion transporter n=1 Tax=Sulfurihydrogenibium sp. (strain YO3AOP1) TaxID=436114 RepID=UPI0001725165|nr:ion transporter [Sulfurihydrogenibium sp. YO3AOP1]ACD66628.1 hypothetical protein SYO3AOP1_1009 [Sulfurihydrogenibium sp. YO3AOP1]